jgi:PiT family inorganic phosphate transporter
LLIALSALLAVFLAYANGANDNFKGVATLFGSGTVGYRTALFWGTGTTLLGSVVSVWLARGLLMAFGGRGLVPDELAGSLPFVVAVALAAGTTVILATRIGFPISTTHALIGALVGAGLVGSTGGVQWLTLGRVFLAPLAITPLLAVVLAVIVYRPLRALRRMLRVEADSCICVGVSRKSAVLAGEAHMSASIGTPNLEIVFDHEGSCPRQPGRVARVSSRPALATAHFLSAGMASFARGLNDTPKIAALLLVTGFSDATALLAVGTFMAVGGLIGARRVALTMGQRITEMNTGQGFVANIVTSFLVIFASGWGVPASATHVSCGALFGIGAATGRGNLATIRNILLAWLITLPVAAALAAAALAIQTR